jgi:hypothetical protein
MDEAAMLLNRHRTVVIQAADDNGQPVSYYIEPGGAVGRQEFWAGVPARLLGFRRDSDATDVEIELLAFYGYPQEAVGLYPVFEDRDGATWTSDKPIVSVRAAEEPEGRPDGEAVKQLEGPAADGRAEVAEQGSGDAPAAPQGLLAKALRALMRYST